MDGNKSTELEGFLLINKPELRTSFSCIAQIKRLLPRGIKVGHAGTLDAFATGLLIVGISRKATRELGHILKYKKQYIATGKLGTETDTLDRTGIVISDNFPDAINRDELARAVHFFETIYTQTPPLFSALKYRGRRLSDLARKNSMAHEKLCAIQKMKARTVIIYKLVLLDVSLPYFSIQADVSQGTYIRSLVQDIAKRVDSCAMTYKLQRLSIGPFHVNYAVDMAQLCSESDIRSHLLPLNEVINILSSNFFGKTK